MSDQQRKLNCVACKAYLFEDDDVVHCPVCGAPHHRECYKKSGHCALEELHGTSEEYDIDKIHSETALETEEKNDKDVNVSTVNCRICGEEFDSNLGKCPHCSSPNFFANGSFAQFDFLGGVPSDYNIDEDVTAEEAKKFVVSNTHRYIPKFVLLSKNKKVSWNWMAFLLPSSWMLSRKMYKSGIITGLLSIISVLLTLPLAELLPVSTNYSELMEWMMQNLQEIGPAVLIVAFIGSSLSIVIQILAGLFGDYMYKNHVIKSIKEIKKNSEDIEFDLQKKGGSNMILFFFSALALQYLPYIIESLL